MAIVLNQENKQIDFNVDAYQGQMSFSGADYKAVIYLPVNTEYIENKIESLEQQKYFTDVRNSAIISAITQYDNRIFAAADSENTALEALLLRERNMFAARYRYHMGGTYLSEESKALQAEIEKLANAISKGGKYVHPIVLGDLQTLSTSSAREKFPVRTLGRIYPHAYVRGNRTLAGSMIFTVMNKHALFDLVEAQRFMSNTGVDERMEGRYPSLEATLVDQLPPFDITILGANELGDQSYAVLYGVEIVNEGQTLSIEDLITECVMQFVARDYDPLRPLSEGRPPMNGQRVTYTASDVLRDKEKERRIKRSSTFI